MVESDIKDIDGYKAEQVDMFMPSNWVWRANEWLHRSSWSLLLHSAAVAAIAFWVLKFGTFSADKTILEGWPTTSSIIYAVVLVGLGHMLLDFLFWLFMQKPGEWERYSLADFIIKARHLTPDIASVVERVRTKHGLLTEFGIEVLTDDKDFKRFYGIILFELVLADDDPVRAKEGVPVACFDGAGRLPQKRQLKPQRPSAMRFEAIAPIPELRWPA